MIVMKFGGSSLESRESIERVARIVASAKERHPLVVVSAMGKTTNRLIAMAEASELGARDKSETLLSELREDTLALAKSSSTEIPELFEELRELLIGLAIVRELTPRSLDLVASFGERISSLVVAEELKRIGLCASQEDSRRLVVTDNNFTQAAPIFSEITRRCSESVLPRIKSEIIVVGGFIGATLNNETTTLGRGGSDYSAALLGAACNAEEIQIWTDVDGMLSCDPRILAGGHRIRRISFQEAAELAYFGAKVLHPSTVLPAIEKNIPVRVLNSRNPESDGTLISAESVACENIFKSIACKTGIISLHIHSTRMLMAHGFLKMIFEIFDRYSTPVDMIATSEVSVSVTIDSPKQLEEIVSELSQFSEVSVESHQSIVTLVGEGLQQRAGVLAELFAAVKELPVRMVSQGASDRNITFVVQDSAVKETVSRLHAAFFSNYDETVFAPGSI